MEKIKVVYKEVARVSIRNIALFIENKGYSETALKFAERLYQFGYSLADFPDKYPICRFKKFAKRKLHCAVFESNYFFIYKVINNKLVIHNIIHSKTLK